MCWPEGRIYQKSKNSLKIRSTAIRCQHEQHTTHESCPQRFPRWNRNDGKGRIGVFGAAGCVGRRVASSRGRSDKARRVVPNTGDGPACRRRRSQFGDGLIKSQLSKKGALGNWSAFCIITHESISHRKRRLRDAGSPAQSVPPDTGGPQL